MGGKAQFTGWQNFGNSVKTPQDRDTVTRHIEVGVSHTSSLCPFMDVNLKVSYLHVREMLSKSIQNISPFMEIVRT